MHLMVNAATDGSGKRVYTLKKVLEGKVTKSAHPARFSPDDKWSKHRVLLRKRFGRLPSAKGMFLVLLLLSSEKLANLGNFLFVCCYSGLRVEAVNKNFKIDIFFFPPCTTTIPS